MPDVENYVSNMPVSLSALQNGDVINRLSTFCVAKASRPSRFFPISRSTQTRAACFVSLSRQT
jgi:hypothetical protein